MMKARMMGVIVTVGGVAFSQLINAYLTCGPDAAASIHFMLGILTTGAALVTIKHFEEKYDQTITP